MTGHLTKIQSPIGCSYFEKIEYAKVPAFWTDIMNVHQLQHALASVSDKVLSQDGRTDMDLRGFPPELNQPFDMSLLETNENIPDGNASSVAVTSYVIRVLQIVICESSMYNHQLMYLVYSQDPKTMWLGKRTRMASGRPWGLRCAQPCSRIFAVASHRVHAHQAAQLRLCVPSLGWQSQVVDRVPSRMVMVHLVSRQPSQTR